MDFFQAVEARYSHKEMFLPTSVPLEDLEKIARAGLAAPTGNNAQEVSLVLLPDRVAIDPLCDVVVTDGLRSAPAAIAVLADPSIQKEGHNYVMEDCAAAVENMLLAATALGYASVWLDGIFRRPGIQKPVLHALGAPESLYCYAVLPVGKPEGEGSRRIKRPCEERLSYGLYGTSKP